MCHRKKITFKLLQWVSTEVIVQHASPSFPWDPKPAPTRGIKRRCQAPVTESSPASATSVSIAAWRFEKCGAAAISSGHKSLFISISTPFRQGKGRDLMLGLGIVLGLFCMSLLSAFPHLYSLNVGYLLTRLMERSGALLNWFHRFNGPWRSTDD